METNNETCQVCGSDLKEEEIHLKTFFLRGPLSWCNKCGILYFRRGASFISPDGHIALRGAEGDPFVSLTHYLKESGSKIVVTDIDHSTIMIKPFRDHTNNIEKIAITIGSRRLDKISSRIIHNITSIIKTARLVNAQQAMELKFTGFSIDPRPEWEIPEIATWFFDTWWEMPELAFFITPESFFVFSLVACFGFREKYIGRVLHGRPSLKIYKILKGDKSELLSSHETCESMEENIIQLYHEMLKNLEEKGINFKDEALCNAAQRMLLFEHQSNMAIISWAIDSKSDNVSGQQWYRERLSLHNSLWPEVLPILAAKKGKEKHRWWQS